MLLKLRDIFRSFTKFIADSLKYRELNENEINELCDKLFLDLIEADVAFDVAQIISDTMRQKLREKKIPRSENPENVIMAMAKDVIANLLARGKTQNFLDIVRNLLQQSRPVKIVFIGVNGVGKTTTIAKVAYLLIKNSIKSVIVAADTFRAGAQEQLKKHSTNLGIPFIGGKYGVDPAAIAFDGINYANRNNYDVVLIDTAGRMHIDIDLMNELKKLAKVVNPHIKMLVIDALTGNDAVDQAKLFDEAIGVDGIVLTKVDADAKGGTALSIIVSIGKPIYFIGIGQRYNDLEIYDPELILERLFR